MLLDPSSLADLAEGTGWLVTTKAWRTVYVPRPYIQLDLDDTHHDRLLLLEVVQRLTVDNKYGKGNPGSNNESPALVRRVTLAATSYRTPTRGDQQHNKVFLESRSANLLCTVMFLEYVDTERSIAEGIAESTSQSISRLTKL